MIFKKQGTVQLIIILIKRQLIKIIITIQIQTKNAKRFMISKITRQKIQKSKMMMNKMTQC